MVRKVTLAADLRPPRSISADDLKEICGTFKIPFEQQDMVRDFLADAVAGFGESMARQATLPNRRDDRVAIKQMIDHLRRAEHLLRQKRGSAGFRALQFSARKIAPAISDVWLKSRFPNDFAPNESYRAVNYNPLRPSPRDLDLLGEAEEWSIDSRVDLMSRMGGVAIAKLLADQIAALEDGRRMIVNLPSGRKPLADRAYMLAALAWLWRRLGRRPSSGISSQFGAFCEAVLESMGWPTDGVNAALPDAIKLSQDLYR
jgi:hypothetical protein